MLTIGHQVGKTRPPTWHFADMNIKLQVHAPETLHTQSSAVSLVDNHVKRMEGIDAIDDPQTTDYSPLMTFASHN